VKLALDSVSQFVVADVDGSGVRFGVAKEYGRNRFHLSRGLAVTKVTSVKKITQNPTDSAYLVFPTALSEQVLSDRYQNHRRITLLRSWSKLCQTLRKTISMSLFRPGEGLEPLGDFNETFVSRSLGKTGIQVGMLACFACNC
jgi:hypothetical protein